MNNHQAIRAEMDRYYEASLPEPLPMDYRTVPLSICIARANEHPVYGNVKVLTMLDEGGGAYFRIHDNGNFAAGVEVELPELELMVTEARKLLASVKATSPHSLVMP
jgi:hypothetical protein